MAGDTCDCCGRSDQEILGVASSGLGAVSFAWCRECLRHGAEPFVMLVYLKQHVAFGRKENLIPQAMQQVTWHEGEYRTFEQVWDQIPVEDS